MISEQAVARSIYGFDSLLGFWGLPNVVTTVSVPHLTADPITVEQNEDGLRMDPLAGRDLRRTVVCLGGSHTWGGGVQKNDRYTERLAAATGRTVINMGHASLGLDQVCLAVRHRTAVYDPDIVVVEQYPWALVRLFNNYVNGYVKPVFRLEADGRLVLQPVLAAARYKPLRRLIGTYYEYRKGLREFRSGIDLGADYDRMTDPLFLCWKVAFYEEMYHLTEQIIGLMKADCERRGIKLMFALGAIYQQFQPAVGTELVDVNLPRNRLKAVLDHLRVPYVDMTEAMLREHDDADPVIFQDGHINAKGHRVFSETLHGTLTELGWL